MIERPALWPAFRASALALAAFAALGCSGKVEVRTTTISADAGGSSGGGGTGAVDGGANAVGGAANAGNAGVAGSTGATGGTGGAACSTDVECAAAPVCSVAVCERGRCVVEPAPFGTPTKAPAAVCLRSVCDGEGAVREWPDPSNLPPYADDCKIVTCDAQGNAGSEPAAAGSLCTVDGGQLCDGAGNCVACLTDDECPKGQDCVAHACVDVAMSGCGNGVLDGKETDVDCGGDCKGCAVGASCGVDQDCASDTCEPVAKTCLSPTCIDQKQDNDETDLDCGGSCSPCIPNGKCKVNADCTNNRCDPMLLKCIGSACSDHRMNGLETDVDCGGPNICPRCQPGRHCVMNGDCQVGHTCDMNVGMCL